MHIFTQYLDVLTFKSGNSVSLRVQSMLWKSYELIWQLKVVNFDGFRLFIQLTTATVYLITVNHCSFEICKWISVIEISVLEYHT